VAQSGSEMVVFCSLEESVVGFQVHVELHDQSADGHAIHTTYCNYVKVYSTYIKTAGHMLLLSEGQTACVVDVDWLKHEVR